MNPRPAGGHQNHDRQRAVGGVLQVAKVRVGRDEHIEARFDRGGDEFAVLQARLVTFVRRLDRVPDQNPSEWCRSPLVYEDQHLRFCKGAAGRVVEHHSRLFESGALDRIDQLVDRSIVFKVLKESRHRHAAAAKYLGFANPYSDALGGGAGGPVNHARNGSPARIVQCSCSQAPVRQQPSRPSCSRSAADPPILQRSFAK